MATFIVEGRFKAGIQWEKFSKEIEAENVKNAREKVYSTFGSKHRIERRFITIESIKEA